MTNNASHLKHGRRDFLKGLGAASAAVAGATTLPGKALATATDRKPRYGMLIDTRKCVGCHACSVSCRSENNVPMGKHRSWVEYIEKGTFPDVSLNFLPRLCNQCSEPQCVSVCPANATYIRDDGIVVIDPDTCIGCKYCIQACPYDARFLNPETGAADKCDFCVDRLAQGMEPACVASCFNKARIFGDLNDPDSGISRMIASNAVSVLRPEMGTKPNVFYIGIDYADEHDIRFQKQYIRVTTHRDGNARR
jgi:tetrathionate reductase subunit B